MAAPESFTPDLDVAFRQGSFDIGVPDFGNFNPDAGREYGNHEYMIGPRRKHEAILPKGMVRKPMPSLDRPWWKPEVSAEEKSWRPFRGRGPR